MARNSSGVYSLPAGNPVLPNTDIESTWANATLSDIAETLTNSLDVLGRGSMQAALKVVDGTVADLAVRFTNDPDNGVYRSAANAWALVAGGSAIVALTTSGIAVTGNIAVTGTVNGRDVASDGTKLDTIASGAQVNVATNLAQGTRTATEVPVTSSTGTDATLTAATALLAGVMVAADKVKLDGIAAGAEVNSVDSVAGKTGAVTLVKGDVGLGNVDNTSDATKNSATATLTNKTLISPIITENIQVISVSTTAVRGRTYIFTASLTLTLPASPAAGDKVSFANRSGTATPVIARNAQNIMGLAENLTVDDVNYFGTLVFADATRGWVFQ